MEEKWEKRKNDLEKEKEEILKKLSSPEFLSNYKNFEEASKKLKAIETELNLLKEIKKAEKKIEEAKDFLALTGDKELAIEAGCNDYITKPINAEDLFILINKYCEKINSELLTL